MLCPKVGLYLRLSRDDGDREESMSISNQRAFLWQYADRQGWNVVDTYIDDGYTGTNFDRPDFQRMLWDIDQGHINTVVTKDLSRLGRDQIGTMYYYQIHFPRSGVRYISVSEGIDTATPGGMSQALPFLAAANDFYTADISRKVRAALDTRKQGGFFIGSYAPLGYLKDPNQCGHLLANPQTAPVIPHIFRDYLTHGSIMGTAKRLTEQGVPTPSQWKGAGPTQSRFPGVWSDTMVRRILTNPTYAGHLTQNRSQKVNYKVNDRRSLPTEDWVIVPHTHTALVSQEEFDRVQEMIRVRSYRSEGCGAGHLLTGLAFCADCGSPMTYVRESATRTYMVCQGYRRSGRLGLCTSHRIREDDVIEAVREQLQFLSGGLDTEELSSGFSADPDRQQIQRKMGMAQRQLEDCKAVIQSIYTDKVTGVLTQKEFGELFARVRQDRERLEQYLAECAELMAQKEDRSVIKARLEQILSFESLDRAILVSLIERVLIHKEKEIEIYFRFQRP